MRLNRRVRPVDPLEQQLGGEAHWSVRGLVSTGTTGIAGALLIRRSRFGAMDLQTALSCLLSAAICCAPRLISIVFCAAHGSQPLLIADTIFFPVGVIHGIGV